jgi:hypothetical protein
MLHKWKNKKELDNYMKNSRNNSIISPNKRFDILVNFFFRNNKNNSDIDSVLKGTR